MGERIGPVRRNLRMLRSWGRKSGRGISQSAGALRTRGEPLSRYHAWASKRGGVARRSNGRIAVIEGRPKLVVLARPVLMFRLLLGEANVLLGRC